MIFAFLKESILIQTMLQQNDFQIRKKAIRVFYQQVNFIYLGCGRFHLTFVECLQIVLIY